MTRKQKKTLLRIILTAILTAVLHFLPIHGWARGLCYLVPYFIIGYDILGDALHGLLGGRLLDEKFLMAIATIGAFVLGALDTGDYTEAVSVMLFFQTGELFQSCAVGKSRRNIAQLMDIRPDYANLVTQSGVVQLSVEQVDAGSEIMIYPGERVPLDGVVLEGCSSVSTVALTGESLPRDIEPGDSIVSGSVNLSGVLKVRTESEYGSSTVARILELIENAGMNKSRSENFISRFALIYTPVVCAAALALAVVPPLVGIISGGFSPMWTVWLYRALSFLVASCPCALVISIPLTFFASIGGAGKQGILVKGSTYLEALAHTSAVVLDKTGTLTEGSFTVTVIHPVDIDRDRFVYLLTAAESLSPHPIARSIVMCLGTPDCHAPENIREIGGSGIECTVDGTPVLVGNRRLMDEHGVDCLDPDTPGTVVHLSSHGKYLGYVTVEDVIKSSSVEAMEQLSQAGVSRTVMLSGDREQSAARVAAELGNIEYRSGLLPTDKVRCFEEILASKRAGTTAVFVGDGINDAPVLARADVGIAMGAIGSSAAIESADIVLMDDDPRGVPRVIRIARRCMRIVKQNMIFSIAAKVLALVLVALGLADMWLAVFADVGVMVLAVLNSTRALLPDRQ